MPRLGRLLWVPALGSLLVVVSAARARAQDACIAEASRVAVTACPASPSAPSAQGSDAPTHVPPAHAPTPAPTVPPTGPGVELDPRSVSTDAELRARELLEREVVTLQRILERPPTAQHASYLARLADTQVELWTYWDHTARALDAPLFEARQPGATDDPAAIERRQHDAESAAAAARDGAIGTYAALVRDHPDAADLDHTLYSLAYLLEQAHQTDDALAIDLRLVRDFPASRYVPHAWLAFGEHAFATEDMEAAARFYERVLETPPEAPNPVYGYALYKLAWVHYDEEDFAGALRGFVRVLEHAAAHPDAHDAEALARQARHELVLPYARVGRPAQALAFFRRYASDDDQAIEMLEDLGELYESSGAWPEAVQVFHALMAERPASERLCHWQSRVTSDVISSRPKAEQVVEVHRLVDVMNAFASSHAGAEVAECRQTTASVIVELATAWHREAIGDDAQPGTRDRGTMRLARELYDLAIAELPDMERLEYPEIDRRDWPTLYRVTYFRAELLWRMEEFVACGPAFDAVVALDPAGEYAADAAYATVLCYDRVYQAEYLPRERERLADAPPAAPPPRGRRSRSAEPPHAVEGPQPARELTATESAMVRAFQRYLCTVSADGERATVQYRLGRVYYEARHFEEASVAFRAVALEHAESELGPIAANLHLDALNAIYRREGRESCVTSLRADVGPFRDLYCATPEASDTHTDLCPVLAELECEVLRLDAEALAHQGAHARAARSYVALARDHAACGRRDEMLWNAAIEYEAARLVGRAIQVRQALVEGIPGPLADRAVYLVGASYHALAIYGSAADWYERFAREHPDADGSACSEADRAGNLCAIAYVGLENAVFFRLGLGETDRAIEDAALYARSFGRSRPRETAEVVFSIGSVYEGRRDGPRLIAHYRAFLRDHARAAPPHLVLAAEVAMGRAELAGGRPDRAAPHFRAAVSAWEQGGEAAIASASGTEEEHALWLARARDSVSEARFALAEERFEAFRAIHFPRFTGQRTLAAVMRWSSGELGPWLTRRFAALHAAEEAYDEIAPLAIPEWQIAAAERVGEMYRTIVDDVRSAPVPAEIEDDDELYGIYATTLERVLDGSSAGADRAWDTPDDVVCTPTSTEPSCTGAPLRQATEHFRYCLTLATRVRWFDDRSAQCERELHAMDAATYPMAAELRGTPVFDEPALALPRPVELAPEAEEDGREATVVTREGEHGAT